MSNTSVHHPRHKAQRSSTIASEIALSYCVLIHKNDIVSVLVSSQYGLRRNRASGIVPGGSGLTSNSGRKDEAMTTSPAHTAPLTPDEILQIAACFDPMQACG